MVRRSNAVTAMDMSELKIPGEQQLDIIIATQTIQRIRCRDVGETTCLNRQFPIGSEPSTGLKIKKRGRLYGDLESS